MVAVKVTTVKLSATLEERPNAAGVDTTNERGPNPSTEPGQPASLASRGWALCAEVRCSG
jgi:hypothetical protein